jgi:hypothetical protein
MAGAAGPSMMMVRPHRIAMGAAGEAADWNRAEGIVHRITYVGDVIAFDVQCGDAMLSVEQHTQPGQAIPREGERVPLAWRVADTLSFSRPA